MTKKSLFMAAIALLAFGLQSCQDENNGLDVEIPQVEISQAVLNAVENFGLNAETVEIGEITYPDGSTEERIIVEGDYSFTEEELLNRSLFGGITTEQYRTFNLVNNNRTIRVVGWNANNSNGLTTNMRTGLSRAINNYNRLNTGLNFTLSFGSNVNAGDIIVFRVANGQAGGQAGFPSNGNPFKFVQIFSGLDSANGNVNEHVITHEIGHSIGMRHTDWFSRQSCGQNTNEGSGANGAVHIPGTPTGFDPNSLMLACFSNSTNGEFGANDRRAIEFLY